MSHPSLEQKPESPFLQANTSALLVKPVSVLVVDDHALVRAAISQVLASQIEIEHVISAQNYAEAEAQAAKRNPDIICLDMQVICSDSIAEIYRLRRLSPKSRIMAFSDVEDEQEGFAAIMAGAQGYWSKQDVDPDNIITIIRSLCRGEFVLRPALLTRLMQRLRAAAMPIWGTESASSHRVLLRAGEFKQLAHLTTREREVLQLISQGYRDRDIAEGLHISEKTVQKHVQSILNKLGAQNRTEAAYIIHHHSTS